MKRKLLFFLVLLLAIAMYSMIPSVMAQDHFSPPDPNDFEHLAVEPTTYTYTPVGPNTQLEIVIMGESCINWRVTTNYNWWDQDIMAPFSFPCDPATIISVTMELRVYDIDDTAVDPEIDEVSLNGVYIGTLYSPPVSEEWGWNTFSPSASLIVSGENHIDIDVDTTHTSYYWATTVDWIKVTILYAGPPHVIPEVPFGTIMASTAMVIALLAFVTMPKWRRKQQYFSL